MELRARTLLPRRVATMAALGGLAASALALAAPEADAKAKAKKPKLPVVTKVAPLDVAVGEVLTIKGRNFVRGRNKNTVVFKRDGARAVFAKAATGTRKQLRVKVPTSLQEFFGLSNGEPVPTRFRIRVLAKRFGKRYTSVAKSPVVSAPRPPRVTPPQALPDGDCDGDGARNRDDGDDDNDGLTDAVETSLSLNLCAADSDDDGLADKWEFDCDRDSVLNRDEGDDDDDLLPDGLETAIGTDPCGIDTDGDSVEDGYEYRSAVDLNDDEYQQPNADLFYPAKLPYPNPRYPDAATDFDGDSLTLAEEQALWRYTFTVTGTDARTLAPLSYSDGIQYSRYGRDAGRRVPTLAASTYDKRAQFIAWASAAGYRTVQLSDGPPWWAHPITRSSYGLFDVDRSGGESASELYYNDIDGDDMLSDDERDEDADGLTNYDETHGRLTPAYWSGCYSREKPYYVPYQGTRVDDPDTDGDGIRDGADDQDHDDVQNLAELSRIAASHIDDRKGGMACVPRDEPKLEEEEHPTAYGRVNPFNPCLPARWGRSCTQYFNADTGAPFDNSPNWWSLN
jgi:hypothetical protein